MPSTAAYRHRFGSLVRAYELVGFKPERDYGFIETNRQLRGLYPQLVDDVLKLLVHAGAQVERDPTSDILVVNGQFTVSLVVSRYEVTPAGAPRWTIRFDRGLDPDLTIAVRMDDGNASPLDYYLLPSLDIRAERLRIAQENFLGIDAYRCDSLEDLVGIAERGEIEAAA